MTEHEVSVLGMIHDTLAKQGKTLESMGKEVSEQNTSIAVLTQKVADRIDFDTIQFTAIRSTLDVWQKEGTPTTRQNKIDIKALHRKLGSREGDDKRTGKTAEFDLSVKGLHMRGIKPIGIVMALLATALLALAIGYAKEMSQRKALQEDAATVAQPICPSLQPA